MKRSTRGALGAMQVFLAVLLSTACGGDVQQSLSLKAAGLWRTANELAAPPGALSVANNAVIRRPGVAEARRGQKPDTNLASPVREMASFEGLVVAHAQDGTMRVRNAAGSATTLPGTYTAPTGHPMRFAEASGGLYFTTNAGLYRMDSPTSTPVPAGVPPGLEGKAETTGSTGWLAGGSPATGTVTLAGGAGDVTVVINGTSVGPVAFSVDDATTAANTASAINGNGTLASLVTATSLGGVITITTATSGSTVNYSLSASRTAGTATASGSALTGGAVGATVGYRFVWGVRDEDGQLLIGGPSGRIVITNDAGAARNVLLTAVIPDGITTSHFLQVYRTVIIATGGADPGEDMAQVGEVFPTAGEIAARTLTFTDTASFANGPAAYFSPNVGAGLADAKLPPPLLTDAIKFEGYTFGVVQSCPQGLNLSLLGVGTDGLENAGGLQFIGSAWNETFKATVATEGTVLGSDVYSFVRTTTGTVAENLEATVQSLVRVINLRSSHLYATYGSGPSDIPGLLICTTRTPGESPVTVRAVVNGGAWSTRLRVTQSVDLQRAANVVTVFEEGNAGLVIGQSVIITSTNPAFPSGTKIVTSVPTSGTFTYAEAGANATALVQSMTTNTPDVEMDQVATPGSWAHSAYEEPDAWPPRFRYQLGGPSTVLYRITAQGEALLFWTSDGLYRLTGSTESDFTIRPLDPTARLVGESTPVSMGNRAFGLTTQGVVSVTELGVEKISTPVDVDLLPYYGSTAAARALTDASAFGVGYQSENEYMLFLPNADGSPGDPATQAYVYNTQTGTWARHTWEWAAINAGTKYVRSGLVNPADDFLYLGAGNWLTRERKARALTDYQDADGVGVPFDIAYQVQTASNPAAYKQWVETTLLLERPQPASVYLYLTTEIDSNEEGGTITSKGNTAVRTYIPRNKSRSARLTVGMRHSTALEKPSVLGLSVSFNVASTKVGR